MQKDFHISYRNVPTKFEREYKTVPDCIRYWAEIQPEKEAVIFLSGLTGRCSTTFKEVYDNSERFAKSLVNIGVQSGNIVGMNIPNSPEFIYAMFGTIMAGAIPVAISFTYVDGSDIISLINKLKVCKIFVLDPGEKDKKWMTLRNVLDSFDTNGHTISARMPSLETVIFTASPISPDRVLLMSDMLQNVDMDIVLPILDPEDIAILFQTSGSTGMPKAVTRTHHSLIYALQNGPQVASREDIFYNERQFGWSGGFPFNFFQDGHTLVTRSLQSSDAIESSEYLIRAVRQENCTVALALPPVLRELIQRKDEIKPNWGLDTIICGGQPLSKFYASCVGTLCKTFKNLYGSTEMYLLCNSCVSKFEDYEEYSCGSPSTGFEIKFADDDDHVVPVNTRGELWVRGPNLFLGYYNDNDRTEAVITPAGWHKSDDVGYMTEKGTIVIEGRKSDTIVSGGLDIVPAIMESVLRTMGGVKDAFVVPIPHPELFQVICACVVKMDGASITVRDVQNYVENFHLDEQRAFTVVPSYYLFFEKFPQTSTGKVSRSKLATEAIHRLK